MLRIGLCLFLLAGVSAVNAQSPVPAPAPQPAQLDPKLVAHLLEWQKQMGAVEKFAVEATLKKTKLDTKRDENWKATLWMMKPGMARMNLVRVSTPGEKPNPNDFDAFICNGKTLYHYEGSTKTVTAIALGANGAGNNMLLDLLSGMTAQQLVNRFEVALLKEDANYVYLELKPRHADDKSEFTSMTLALCGPQVKGLAYMPRSVRVMKPNGQEVEDWDFPAPKVNPDGIKPADFAFQPPPKDWRVQEAQAPKPNQTPVNVKLPTPGGK